jgi:hypothetical protein
VEHPLPDPGLCPAREPRVHLIGSPRQVTPRNAGAIAVEDRLDEQPVIACGHPDRARAAGQQVLNPVPLIVA